MYGRAGGAVRESDTIENKKAVRHFRMEMPYSFLLFLFLRLRIVNLDFGFRALRSVKFDLPAFPID